MTVCELYKSSTDNKTEIAETEIFQSWKTCYMIGIGIKLQIV